MALSLSTPLLLEIWRRAASPEEEFGIAIKTDPRDRDRIREALYRARGTILDPTLQDLTLCMPKNGEIWIVKKTVELEL